MVRPLNKIILLGLVLSLISSAYAIDCDFASISSYAGYSAPNLTIYEDDELFCNSTTLKLRGSGLNWVTNFTIEGEFKVINSTIETAYDLNTTFSVKEGAIFHSNNSEFVSMENTFTSKRVGKYNISLERGSDVKLENISFHNLSNFKAETDTLILKNIELFSSPFVLHDVIVARIYNISTRGGLLINDSRFIEIYDSVFEIKNESQIFKSSNIIIANSIFYMTNESNLKITDSDVELNNITQIYLDDGLIINPGAETGDTIGWSGIDQVTSSNVYDGSYAFSQTNYSIINSDFFKVSPHKAYYLDGQFKSNSGELSKVYFGFNPYDENKKSITHKSVNSIPGTETTLYENVTAGDQIIKITDGSNWEEGGANFIAFNIEDNYKDLPNHKTYGYEILNTTNKGAYWEVNTSGEYPIPDNYSAGTRIRQHKSGGSYMYVAASSKFPPNDWINFKDESGVYGISDHSTNLNQWWPRTKFAKVVILANHNQNENQELLLDNINLRVSNINLHDGTYLKVKDTNSSLIHIVDEDSSLDQYYTLTYNITNKRNELQLPFYFASSYDKNNNLFMTQKADKNGIVKLPLHAFKKNYSETMYYSNYTTFFTKDSYETINDSINLTEQEKIHLEMKSTKGIVPVGSNCTSEFAFCVIPAEPSCSTPSEMCAENNPVIIEGMKKGDSHKVIFTVNATGNGFDIKGKNFPFFSIIESEYEEIVTTESDEINVTVVAPD